MYLRVPDPSPLGAATVHTGLQYRPCREHSLQLFRVVYTPLEYGSPESYDLNYNLGYVLIYCCWLGAAAVVLLVMEL